MDVSSCAVIDQPGRYRLTDDVTDDDREVCLEIRASDVHVDGNGHTLAGDAAPSSVGVLVDGVNAVTNVTVSNTTLTGWGVGVVFEGVSDGRIANATVANTTDHGIEVVASPGTAVVENEVVGVEGQGITVEDGSDESWLDNNTVHGAGEDGIVLAGIDTVPLVTNSVVENGDVGIDIQNSENVSLLDNVAARNEGADFGYDPADATQRGDATLINATAVNSSIKVVHRDPVIITNFIGPEVHRVVKGCSATRLSPNFYENDWDETWWGSTSVLDNYAPENRLSSVGLNVLEISFLRGLTGLSSNTWYNVDLPSGTLTTEYSPGCPTSDAVLTDTGYEDYNKTLDEQTEENITYEIDPENPFEIIEVHEYTTYITKQNVTYQVIAAVAESGSEPDADAGTDQTVTTGDTVVLDGTRTTDADDSFENLSFEWEQIDGPSVTLSNGDTATPSFDAPDVENETTLSFRLNVTDPDGLSDTDVVNVTVTQPPAENQPPIADAGPDETATEGTPVTLDAIGSSDPDDPFANLTFQWEQTAGPTVTLQGADTITSTFTAPDVDTPQTLTFRVTVTDPDGASDTDVVNVTVNPEPAENQPPVADAGSDRIVAGGDVVNLDASGSRDPDHALTQLDFAWEQIEGPTVPIANNDTFVAAFTAPDVETVTTLRFRVTVTDPDGATDTDTVNVTIQPQAVDNQPPVADAGPDQTVSEGDTVALDGTGTADPDDAFGNLSFAWEQISGPGVTLQDDNTSAPEFTAPNVASETTLSFRVTVTDPDGANDTDTVAVTVEPTPPENQPPVADAGADQTVMEGDVVDLDATGSSDPDDAFGNLSFAWEQITGPPVTLQDTVTAAPSFTAPDVGSTTTLQFGVTVTDPDGANDTDVVNVTVEPAPPENQPPIADAGLDQTVSEGDTVALDGTGTADPDDTFGNLSFAWEQTAGQAVTLQDGDTSTPEFTAPNVASETTLSFRMTVTDSDGANDTDVVNVTVQLAPPENQPPVADAGPDQTVSEGDAVDLDATGSSDPDDAFADLSFEWEQTDGPGVTLQDDDTATPSFTAPNVESPTTLQFRVTVTDPDGTSDTDIVNVTVEPALPENRPPVADAGPDQTVTEGDTVSLDATDSSDPDDAFGNLSFAWEQTAGQAVTLQDGDTATPEFTAPNVASETTLSFRVTVTDSDGANDTDIVTVTVEPAPPTNQPPVADAGPDKTVTEGGTVPLDATGSNDPDDAFGNLSFAWEQIAGQAVTLDGNDTATPTFTAPEIGTETTLSFRVTVTDPDGANDTDTVAVTVEPAPPENQPPVADAGSDQTVTEGDVVDLDATGSSDPDDAFGNLSFAWEQTAGETVTLQDGDTATPEFTATDVDTQTNLTFQVTVTDPDGANDTDVVTVTVESAPPENQPPIADAGSDQTVTEGDDVGLDATGSSDPDDAFGNLSFAWEQTAGQAVTLDGNDTATPTFTAPEIGTETTLSFRMTVTDPDGANDTDTVAVTVEPAPSENQPPVADAGPDQTVTEGDQVTLDATGSSDPDDAFGNLSFEWEQLSGPPVTIQDNDTAMPSFTALNVETETTLTYQVTVTDPDGAADIDIVNVTARPDTDEDDHQVNSCTVIDEPGRYVLSSDIENSDEETCIRINSSDVHFDGGGHTIDGTDASDSFGVHTTGTSDAPLSNVTVTNLTVTDWATGVEFRWTDDAELSEVFATSNDVGVRLRASSNNLLADNDLLENGWAGLDLRGTGSHYNTIRDNDINANDKYGIYVWDSWENQLTANTARENGEWDYYSSDNSVDNTIERLELSTATVSADGKDIALRDVENPPGDPAGSRNIDEYIEVSGTGADAWLNVTIYYSDTNVQQAGINESTLRLWSHEESWMELPSPNTVDIEANTVTTNVTQLPNWAVIAPLGEPVDD